MNDVIVTNLLSKKYGQKMVINGLDLKVPQGSVYGLLGKNGAGKSTTIRMLMGLMQRDLGLVSVLGFDPRKEDIEIKKRVGYVAENADYYDWLSVEKTIGLVANYHQNWDFDLTDEMVKSFRLDLKAKVSELSKGTRAKLSLLLALSHKPKLLILDEPTTGLDPSARREFMESVLSTLPEAGISVFISSHLVNEISPFVDRVGILKGGRLFVDEDTETLLAQVKVVRMVFPDGNLPKQIECEGLIHTRHERRELLATVRYFNEETTMPELQKYNPESMAIENQTLEDIFVGLLPDEEDV